MEKKCQESCFVIGNKCNLRPVRRQERRNALLRCPRPKFPVGYSICTSWEEFRIIGPDMRHVVACGVVLSNKRWTQIYSSVATGCEKECVIIFLRDALWKHFHIPLPQTGHTYMVTHHLESYLLLTSIQKLCFCMDSIY